MKIYKAKLKTGGKTREQIAGMFTFGTASETEINNWERFYKILDGAIVYVTNGLSGTDYALIRWPEYEAARIKEAIYLAEQDTMVGVYIDQREQFDKDWDAGEYSSDGSLTFEAADVEIIEELPEAHQ